MPIHGNKGYVSIGSDELKVKNFSLTKTAPVTDDTAIGDDWETKITGAPKSWSGSLTCSLKKNSAAQTALAVGAEVTVNLYANGNASGEDYFSGSAIVESIDHSQDFSDTANVTFNFVGNGALNEETVA